MKKVFCLLIFIGCVLSMMLGTVSCKKNISFEELKSAENKKINKIIAEKNIEVLHKYPADGVFGENQFVKLKSGIYLNVVDSGNGNRATQYKTTILVRCSGEYYYGDTATTFNTFTNEWYPIEFKYGYASLIKEEHKEVRSKDDYLYYMYLGSGLESIMSYVGDGAVVKLIVPACAEVNTRPACSSMQTSDQKEYVPIYFDKVKYSFY